MHLTVLFLNNLERRLISSFMQHVDIHATFTVLKSVKGQQHARVERGW